jgi:hypothetical protein
MRWLPMSDLKKPKLTMRYRARANKAEAVARAQGNYEKIAQNL